MSTETQDSRTTHKAPSSADGQAVASTTGLPPIGNPPERDDTATQPELTPDEEQGEGWTVG